MWLFKVPYTFRFSEQPSFVYNHIVTEMVNLGATPLLYVNFLNSNSRSQFSVLGSRFSVLSSQFSVPGSGGFNWELGTAFNRQPPLTENRL